MRRSTPWLRLLPFAGSEVVAAIVGLDAATMESREAGAAIMTLRECVLDVAATAVGWLTRLTNHREEEVRLQACSAVEWLELEATEAIPSLVQAALSADFGRATTMAATRVLLKLDAEGKVAPASILEDKERMRISDLLRAVGEPGRRLRRVLEKEWKPAAVESETSSPARREAVRLRPDHELLAIVEKARAKGIKTPWAYAWDEYNKRHQDSKSRIPKGRAGRDVVRRGVEKAQRETVREGGF